MRTLYIISLSIIAGYTLLIIGTLFHAWLRKRDDWIWYIILGIIFGILMPVVPSVTVPFIYIGWSVKEWWKERQHWKYNSGKKGKV